MTTSSARGCQSAAAGSVSDLESLEATIELLSDQAAMARVREAEDAITRGEGTAAEETAALMRQRKARERGA